MAIRHLRLRLPAGSGAESRPPKRFLAFYRRQMAFPGITVVQTECVSTHISLDVLFTLPKNFLLNIFGGLTRNPLLNTALVTALLVYARMNVFAQNAKKVIARRDDMPPADRGGSTSVRRRIRSPHGSGGLD